MAKAAYDIPHFLGGEISDFAQGRFDKPDYRTSLNICVNSFPIEIGVWTRRPGTRHGGVTRGGAAAKTIKFDFQQAAAITAEFTSGFVRFRNGTSLLTANDAQAILAVSAANPAVVQTSGLHGWTTGNTVTFPAPGPASLLEGRQFIATVTDTTHFSLADALTGATIDGSTLGAITAGTLVSRVQELVTPYAGGSWANIRAVQAETTDLLLNGTVAPQALTVPTLPVGGNSAIFALSPANFLDGPYLDQVGGSLISPSGTSGIVTATLSAQLYSAAQAYKNGDVVSNAGITYQSLVDANVGNTPASSPAFWNVVSAGIAVGPNGFVNTDVGRLVRIYNPSLAPAWNGATTYNVGDLATSAGIGYRSLLGGNLNNTPSATSSFWVNFAPGWTWGKITSVSSSGLISGVPAGTVHIGTMSGNGGLNAIFDGTISHTSANSGVSNPGHAYTQSVPATYFPVDYVGQNYTATGAKAITSAIIYPSSDLGFLVHDNNFVAIYGTSFNLRGKATAPASSSDGTLLGQAGIPTPGTLSPVTILSNDSVTTWNYVWVEMIACFTAKAFTTSVYYNVISQVLFFGTGGIAGTSIGIEILGAPLPNATTSSWQLGAYSTTSGYPTCGCYHEGRIWLGGAIPNRFDASVSNGISGRTVNFSPTNEQGVVAANNAISATMNSDSVNTIIHMTPDLQGVIIGTQAGEWLVVAPTAGPIAPANIAVRNITKHGSANVQPCRTEHTNIFVQRFAKKLLEYFPDVYSGKFSAPNLADKAQHITRAGVAELAYTNAMTPILWGRDALGALFGVTYKRDTLASSQPPTFYGWHRHALGSGRTVESICSGPSTGGDLDSLTMVTNDAATNIRHVEILTDTMDEDSALADAWFLDDAVIPTSTSSSATGITLNGLWHLNGKTVQVFAGGLDCGDPGEGNSFSDFVVSNGSVFVPFGDGISAGSGRGLFTATFVAGLPLSQIVVGFTYNSDGQVVRQISAADSGTRLGPSLGALRRNHRHVMLLSNTFGLSVGTLFSKMIPAAFRKANTTTPIDPLTTFSGVYEAANPDDFSYDGMICWRVSRPWPANVIALAGNISSQDQ